MIKRLLAAGALAAMAISPAFAQDNAGQNQPEPATAPAPAPKPAPAEVAQSDAAASAAPVPRAASSYAQVDFNPQDDRDNILVLDLSDGKRVLIRLMPDWAPHHVERIKQLARAGFYNGVIFHRVIDGFMAQTGDPTGTGQGGSTLPDLHEEFNPVPHLRGTVSMARAADDNSANSQFFIVFYPKFALDNHYTNFGRVISGMDGVDEIHRGEPPADPTYILQASIASDNKPVPTGTPIPPKLPPSLAQGGDTGPAVTADQLNNSGGQ